MKNAFARVAAAFGLAALFSTSVFAAPATTPGMAPGTTGTTAVKSHVRHMKSGKTVIVHGYTRPKTGMKMTHVKGYTRTTKTGKVITVGGYNRKAPAKKMKKM